MVDFDVSTGTCRFMPTAYFYPSRGSNETVIRAKAVCEFCPVREACKSWGIRHEVEGVWGGTSGRDRRRLRKEMGITLVTPEVNFDVGGCGTESGYQIHRRKGEETCSLCRRAHNKADLRRKSRAKERQDARIAS